MDCKKVRSLQYVRRFNFERCNRYQSVAEHSAMCAMLAHEAAVRLDWPHDEIMRVVYFALVHDAEEAVTGDIPHLVKSQIDRLEVLKLETVARRELRTHAVPEGKFKELVEYCDALELAMYLQEELQSGNSSLRDILMETYGRISRTSFYHGELGGWTDELLGTIKDDLESFAKDLPTFLKH